MSNSHAVPDMFYELQAVCGDLLPGVIRSHSGLTVPASSMTLAAVAVTGYVMGGTELVYVAQPAVSITLSGSAGTYWLCLHRDLSTAVAGWTRRAGSHYLWQLAGSQPADPVGGLVFASITVAGGIITAVTPLPTPTSPPMSKQLANAVALTGGAATFTSGTTPLTVLGNASVSSRLFVNNAVGTDRRIGMTFDRSTEHGIVIRPNADTGNNAMVFLNASQVFVGGISTTATATSYATSSDQRLKHAIQPLTDAMATLLALRPVAFRWNADDSQDEGFLAHEAQQVVPHAVQGQPDEVNPDGSIKPQQIDHSKLVVWLTAALQEAVAQVQTLTARVDALESALGL